MSEGRALAPGATVAGWRIIRRLGEGGFGVTYEARHHATAEHVALKEYMPAGWCSRSPGSSLVTTAAGHEGHVFHWGRERFIKEAETLGRLDHPSIVRVIDHFEANGTAYMALGFEEGGTLGSWLARLGRRPTDAEIDVLVAPLLDALREVHSLYLQHRDIKPDNIMLRRDGTPVLIDFGAVRSAVAGRTTVLGGVNPAATSTFAIVSHGYSPPEQYDPTGANMGPASDIYALGATLHFALTGEPPPAGPSRLFGDPYEPLARRLADGGRRGSLLAGIDRALAVDPRTRPQSAVEWRRELGIAGGPTRSSIKAQSRPEPEETHAGLPEYEADDGPHAIASDGRAAGHGASRLPLFLVLGLGCLLLAGVAAWGFRPQQASLTRDAVAALVPGSGRFARDCWQDGSRELCGPEMVALPAGSFRMGTPDAEIVVLKQQYPTATEALDRETPARAVTIRRPFAVGRSHVTRGEFAEFVRDTKRVVAGACAVFVGGKFEYPPDTTWQNPGFQQDDRHPIVCLIHDDADAYARWLAAKTGKPYRLLTEAEAEYAARGVTRSTDPHPGWWFGNDVAAICGHANGADQTGAATEGWSNFAPCTDGFTYTAPIRSFRPNAFGLHDVAGNVWTWLQDCWIESYAGAPADERARTTGACTSRAMRGGSWLSGPRLLRAANRWGDYNRARTFGVRVARTLP